MAVVPTSEQPYLLSTGMQNIHVTAYSPLGTPPSSAMFKDYQPDLVMNDPVVKEMAKKYNKNVGQVCCCCRFPAIVVLIFAYSSFVNGGCPAELLHYSAENPDLVDGVL